MPLLESELFDWLTLCWVNNQWGRSDR